MRAWVLLLVLLSSPSTGAAELDGDAVTRAVSEVVYRDCGYGGPGALRITFAPNGTVERIDHIKGAWHPDVVKCVTHRFAAARVPPFEGAAHTTTVLVNLGEPMRDSPFVIPARGERDPPPGYHVEEHGRGGALVSGAIMMGIGAVIGGYYLFGEGGHRDELIGLVSVAHFAVGIPLFCVGLGSTRVFVRNGVGGHPGATLSVRF